MRCLPGAFRSPTQGRASMSAIGRLINIEGASTDPNLRSVPSLAEILVPIGRDTGFAEPRSEGELRQAQRRGPDGVRSPASPREILPRKPRPCLSLNSRPFHMVSYQLSV